MTAPDRGTGVYDDLEAEQDRLDEVPGALGPDNWARPSAAPGWSVSDVVLHLAQTEELVVASVQGDVAPFARDRGRGGSVDEFAARWVEDERSTPPDAVYQRWRTARHAALDARRSCRGRPARCHPPPWPPPRSPSTGPTRWTSLGRWGSPTATLPLARSVAADTTTGSPVGAR